MPKTLNTLYNNTDKGRQTRSEAVSVKHTKTLISKKNFTIKEYVYKTGTGRFNYTTSIRPLNPIQYDLNGGDAPAVVSCSCKDFKYRWEYANAQSQNAEIKYSNGQPALVTNPKNKKQLCKHLYAIKDDVITRNYQNVAELNPKKMGEYIKRSSEKSSSEIRDIAKNFSNKTIKTAE